MALHQKDKDQLIETIMQAIGRGNVDIEAGIRKLRAAGLSEKQILKRLDDDFEKGGPIFGPFFKTMEEAVTRSTGQAFTYGQVLEFKDDASPNNSTPSMTFGEILNYEEDLEDLTQSEDLVPYTWVCALVSTCTDCLPRHGQAETLEDWRAQGLPRSGFSICNFNCKCQLVPTKLGDRMNLKQPLMRAKKDARKAGFKTVRELPMKIPNDLLKRNDESTRDDLTKAAEKDAKIARAMRYLGSINK